jgi:hypothetical protein
MRSFGPTCHYAPETVALLSRTPCRRAWVSGRGLSTPLYFYNGSALVMEYDLTELHEWSKALHERSTKNLQNFLQIEINLGFTFAGLAKQYLEVGDLGHHETSRRNAVAALDAIDHFKDRLPPQSRKEIEAKRLELAALIP